MPELKLTLMFLGRCLFEDGDAIMGGALITDANTKPLEFKCTDPIRPSTLQRTLYGGVLDEHILVELIGKPLVQAAALKADMILVRERLLLELRPHTDVPMLRVFKDTELEGTPEGTELPHTIFTSDSGKYEPVLVAAHRDYVDEREPLRERLRSVFRSHSLLEPFERISAALEQVHTERTKSST